MNNEEQPDRLKPFSNALKNISDRFVEQSESYRSEDNIRRSLLTQAAEFLRLPLNLKRKNDDSDSEDT